MSRGNNKKNKKMELKKYKLADIAKIEISGVDKKTIEGEIPVRLCNFVDVYHNWAITKDKAEHFMLASAKQAEINKCSIAKGQVAITKDSETRDDIGIATYFADDFDNVVLSYHCALITPDPTIVDGKYLNAFMHTKYIQKYFENNASGSGQRYTLSNSTINTIPVLLPSLTEQHTIGKVLADIDRKIELNKQINDNLEEQLRLITSRYIFGCPNLEKKRIGEIATVKAGGDCPITFSKTRTQKCNIPIFSNGTEDRGLYGFTNKANIEGHSITVAARGTIGYCERRLMPFVPIIRLLAITPKEDGAYIYLHQVIRGMKFKKNGSVQQQLTVPEISFIEIPYPHSSVLHEYNKVASPIVEMIERNISENEILTKQRDELLPLLMNGQASINYHLSDD